MMTQIFDEQGNFVPATAIEVTPCVVTQIKTDNKDKYSAVQIGQGRKRTNNKPLTGHLKNRNLENLRYLREFRDEQSLLKVGDVLGVEMFEEGDVIVVSGISKGKGFQGVVKRHKFAGSPASHGHKDQLRMPGSIGATEPKHVFKGTRMAGRMGGDKVTVSNLKVAKIDKEKEILYVKGAVPGAINGLLKIKGKGKIKIRENIKIIIKNSE